MPAWWLGPDLAVFTQSDLLAHAACPVFSALAQPASSPAPHALVLSAEIDAAGIALALDGHRLATCPDASALTFFLESLLTHLATQGNRSNLVLHAGLVQWRGQLIALPGERGAGKSTTTLWLARRGGIYLGDDLCFVDPATLTLRGLAKAATLKQGSFSLYPESETFTDPLRGPVRYFLPPQVRAPHEPGLPLARLVFPRYTPDAPTRTEPLPAPLAALALVQQTYGGGEWGERALRAAAQLAQRPAHVIHYRALNEFEAALEALPA